MDSVLARALPSNLVRVASAFLLFCFLRVLGIRTRHVYMCDGKIDDTASGWCEPIRYAFISCVSVAYPVRVISAVYPWSRVVCTPQRRRRGDARETTPVLWIQHNI